MTPEQERILDLIINAENATPDLLQNIKSTTPRSKLKTIPKTLNSIGNMPKEDFLKLVFFGLRSKLIQMAQDEME